jgi:hypothetical protein
MARTQRSYTYTQSRLCLPQSPLQGPDSRVESFEIAMQAKSHPFDSPIAGRCLVLKIYGELDLAGIDTLDRSAKPAKRNGARTEKRVDCGSAYMVEEVKKLYD